MSPAPLLWANPSEPSSSQPSSSQPSHAVALAGLSALFLCACAASSPPEQQGHPAPSTPSASTTASQTATTASASAASAPDDPMWPLVADRRAFMRSAGDGNTTCEQLTLKPDFPPAAYEGVAQLAPADGEVSFSLRYAGAPPKLSQPTAHLGNRSLLLPCPSSQAKAAWFADRERCEDASAAPLIEPHGCTEALSAQARANAVKTLTGEHRATLLSKLASIDKLWWGSDATSCDKPVQLRTHARKKIRFSGSRKGIPLPERATVIYRGSYPMVLAEASGGGVALIETTMANPFVRRSAGNTGISMGCCATMIYEVLEVDGEGARLRLRSSKDPQNQTRWYWSAEACRA